MINKIIIICIRLYQIILSPMLPNSCRYNVSCSEYAIHNLRFFGVFLGFFWILKRILSCNSWNTNIIEEI